MLSRDSHTHTISNTSLARALFRSCSMKFSLALCLSTIAATTAFTITTAPVATPSTTLQATGMGVNGFGRIGRLVTRIMVDDADVDVKLINAGSATADYMAYQYKYDTIHGKAKTTVEADGDDLILNGVRVPTTRCRDPKEAGWGKYGAHYVCESTGVFLTKEKAQCIIDGGAKKIIYSAPATDDSQTIVMGVNQHEYDGSEDFISCASCTTNGLAPLVKCINDEL